MISTGLLDTNACFIINHVSRFGLMKSSLFIYLIMKLVNYMYSVRNHIRPVWNPCWLTHLNRAWKTMTLDEVWTLDPQHVNQVFYQLCYLGWWLSALISSYYINGRILCHWHALNDIKSNMEYHRFLHLLFNFTEKHQTSYYTGTPL